MNLNLSKWAAGRYDHVVWLVAHGLVSREEAQTWVDDELPEDIPAYMRAWHQASRWSGGLAPEEVREEWASRVRS